MKKKTFNEIEEKILEALNKGEELSISEIADRIKEKNRKKVKDTINNLINKKWLEEVNENASTKKI